MGRHYERASALYDLRRFKDAADAFAQELAEEPNSPQAYAMRAAALGAIREYAPAEQSARRAIELAPEWQFGYYVLGIIEGMRGKFDRAEAAFLESLRLEPNAEVYYRLARIYAATYRSNECLEATSQALELVPQHVGARLLRGNVLMALNRPDEAQALFRAALADGPENSDAFHSLGTIALKYGDCQEALGLLREARRLDPLSNNDVSAIALAYGRTLPPFCWVDRWLARWYLWPHKKRCVLLFLLAALLIAGSVPLDLAWPRNPHALWLWLWIAIGTLLVLPYTFDNLAATVAQIKGKKELDTPWYGVLLQPVLLGWLLLAHCLAALGGIAATAAPEVVVLACQMGAVAPFLGSVVRSPRRRIFSRVACLFLLLIAMIVGTFGSVTALYGPPLGGIALLPFCVLAFFADDIANWFKDPFSFSTRTS